MCDASHWGLGVVSERVDPRLVGQVGRPNERWRFTAGAEAAVARKHAASPLILDANPIVPPDTGWLPASDLKGKQWAEVSDEFLNHTWRRVQSRPWRYSEHISAFGSKAILFGLRHTLRRHDAVGKRILVLTDSMVSTCAMSKGRSGASGISRACRAVAALSLASGSGLHVRWIPGEANQADALSRGPNRTGYAGEGPQPPASHLAANVEFSACQVASSDAAGGAQPGRSQWCPPSKNGEPRGSSGKEPLSPSSPEAHDQVAKPRDDPGAAKTRRSHDRQPGPEHSANIVSGSGHPARLFSDVSKGLGLGEPDRHVSDMRGDHGRDLDKSLRLWYLEGEEASLGSKTLAAVMYFRKGFSRNAGARLLGARQAIKGWMMEEACAPEIPPAFTVGSRGHDSKPLRDDPALGGCNADPAGRPLLCIFGRGKPSVTSV